MKNIETKKNQPNVDMVVRKLEFDRRLFYACNGNRGMLFRVAWQRSMLMFLYLCCSITGGGSGGTGMAEQVPSGNIIGNSGSGSGRGQRYSIDYTTLTEMDRMRAMQQVSMNFMYFIYYRSQTSMYSLF